MPPPPFASAPGLLPAIEPGDAPRESTDALTIAHAPLSVTPMATFPSALNAPSSPVLAPPMALDVSMTQPDAERQSECAVDFDTGPEPADATPEATICAKRELVPELRAFRDEHVRAQNGKVLVALQGITSIYHAFGKHIGQQKLVERFGLPLLIVEGGATVNYEGPVHAQRDAKRFWVNVDIVLQRYDLRTAVRMSAGLPRDTLVYDKEKMDGRDGMYYQTLILFSDLQKSTDPRVQEAVKGCMNTLIRLAKDMGCENPTAPSDWMLCAYGVSTDVLTRVSASPLENYKFAMFQEFRGARAIEFPPCDPRGHPWTKDTKHAVMRNAEDYFAQRVSRISFNIRGVQDYRELCLVRRANIKDDLATLAAIPDEVIWPGRWIEL